MGLFYSILTKLTELALLLPFFIFPWRAALADGLTFQSGGDEFIFFPAIVVVFLLLLARAFRKQSAAARVKKPKL
jgi:membrane protein implicated in regulation of membrane protease activity